MQETDLPIKQVLAEIDAALSGGAADEPCGSEAGNACPRAVLAAPPGAGKSTYLPLHLLKAAWAQSGRIVLLEPRRLAARAVARRMAEQLGEEVGQTVGYLMRMDKKYSAQTRILVMTEGSFSRLILDNPELPGICAVLFDEFHERSLEADFGLALALDAADSLRPDLRILVMSATLDPARAAALIAPPGLPAAPIIEAHGRSFPVEIVYRPRGQGGRGQDRRSERPEEAVFKACRAALAQREGGILVFLPGQAEIKRAQSLLEEGLTLSERQNLLIIPLYGGLPAEAQEQALRPAPPGCRKIVLATSIAESALTIADVRIAIDSGLARLPAFSPASGLSHLQTVRASRAAGNQRAGRAGRLSPGLAVRLWHEGENAALPAFAPPEILNADMSSLLLDCADFGLNSPAELRFLDMPPPAAVQEARQNLQDLGALDAQGRIAPLGRALRQLSLPPILAAMLLKAAALSAAAADKAAKLAVLLTENGLGNAAAKGGAAGKGDIIDLDMRLENFARDKSQRAAKARALAKRLAEKACSQAAQLGSGRLPSEDGKTPSAGELLAAAWPMRLARRREAQDAGDKFSYLLANGRGAALDKSAALGKELWLVCAEISGAAANARIRAAASVSAAWIERNLADKITRAAEVFFDAEAGGLRAVETRKLGAIIMESRPLPPPSGAEAQTGWLEAVRKFGLSILPQDKQAESLRARLMFLHSVFSAPAAPNDADSVLDAPNAPDNAHGAAAEPWPNVDDAALAADLEEWLLPFLPAKARLTAADSGFLAAALRARLSYNQQQELERLAPAALIAPSGARIELRYEGGKAILAGRAQEFYGLREQPKIAGGRVPIILELLSPARRIIQITQDIACFWANGWKDAAAAMRGRYPKHFWPDNPQDADKRAPAPMNERKRMRQGAKRGTRD